MATKAFILARKHGGKKLELAVGPEIPVRTVKDEFKDFVRSGVNDKYEYVELHYAQPAKKRTLTSPKAAAEKQRKSEEAALQAELEAEQKALAAKQTENQ